MSPIRNSAHWMPDIRKLCTAFYTKKLTQKCLVYRENVFSEIDELCNEMVDKVKREIYFNHPRACDCLLDHHKIAAVHLLSVLKKQPFLKECHFAGETYTDVLPNEHYCLLLMFDILCGWHKSNGKTVFVKMPRHYRDCLLLLFRNYRKSPSSSTHDTTLVYALSNIVYLIDTNFVADI